MRLLRHYLGLAIMLAVLASAGPIMRLTNDATLRLVLLLPVLAVIGAGFALMWFNGPESSN
jgi:UDP-N-acetylmuramyl pentapeptide phosphotransferase/UDP-N-acetylglucosamine-1-phosphate transferase